MIKRTIEFILFSSVFIACCAIGMCIETNLLLQVPLNSLSFYVFVFGSTLLQYNLHYLVKKKGVDHSRRLEWSAKNRPVHKFMIVLGSAMIVVSLFSFHLHHFIFLGLLGTIAYFYSFPVHPFSKKKRIKDFGLLKIMTLVLLWTLVTSWFPVDQANFDITSFQLIFFRRFTFMFILCLLFDIRDAKIDLVEGIRTVPVIIGSGKAYFICYVCLVIFFTLSFIQFYYVHNHVELWIMLASALATLFTIEFTKINMSDYTFLALVDGMMLLQAVMVIITSI